MGALGCPAAVHRENPSPCCSARGVWVHPAAAQKHLVLCTALCVPPSPDVQPWPCPAPALHAVPGSRPETSPHPLQRWHEEGPDVPLAQPGVDAGCPGLLSRQNAHQLQGCCIPSPPATHLPPPSLTGLIPPWALSFPRNLVLGTQRPQHLPAPTSAPAPGALAKPAALQRARGQCQRGRELCPPSCQWHSTLRHPPCPSRLQGCTLRALSPFGAPPLSPCQHWHRRGGDIGVPAGARPSTTSAVTTMG